MQSESAMSKNTLLVIADAARARFFQLTSDEIDGSSALQEVNDLVEPEARVKQNERFTDSFPRGHRTQRSGQAHTYDDHRNDAYGETRKRFARSIVEALSKEIATRHAAEVLLVSPHSMHSLLEEEVSRGNLAVQPKMEISELTTASPHEIHVALSRRGVLPPPQRLSL